MDAFNESVSRIFPEYELFKHLWSLDREFKEKFAKGNMVNKVLIEDVAKAFKKFTTTCQHEALISVLNELSKIKKNGP